MNETRAALGALERVFHERGRLAICTTLIAHPGGLPFVRLQEECDLTDGNLNRHLHALSEESIVTTEKRTGRGRPQTIVHITAHGRERFLAYIDALEAVVSGVQASSKATRAPARTVPTLRTVQ